MSTIRPRSARPRRPTCGSASARRTSRFVIPEAAEPQRADDLWQTTCFEAFLRIRGASRIANGISRRRASGRLTTSPRTARAGRDAEVAAPYVRIEDNLTWWAVGATIAVDAEARWELGVSAILEEKDGTKSYWALAHPAGDKPDFHDPACFAAHLP